MQGYGHPNTIGNRRRDDANKVRRRDTTVYLLYCYRQNGSPPLLIVCSSKSGGAGPDAAGKWIEGDEEEAKDDLTEAEQKIFRRYDKKKKGYLTPQEV